MDVLGIAVDVFSAATVGQSFLKDLKALDHARTMELHPACFIAGTQITVQGEDGEATAKPIEEIEAGDRVLATDAETGATEYKEVVRVFVKESDTLVHLTVNGEEITTTPDHPFFVGDEWIAAGDLQEGDLLTLSDGTTASLEKIRIETLDAPVTVYNFEVADFHTYYVGNTQILVHNDCKSGSSTPDIGTGGNKTSVAGESETFYRTMSKDDYDSLVKTRKVSATSETFISPTQSFSEGYNGVTVEFKVKAGTTNQFANIGVRDNSNIVRDVYPNMPIVSKGWNVNSVYFKGEDMQINIGLGRGTGLDIFNENIIDYSEIGSR